VKGLGGRRSGTWWGGPERSEDKFTRGIFAPNPTEVNLDVNRLRTTGPGLEHETGRPSKSPDDAPKLRQQFTELHGRGGLAPG